MEASNKILELLKGLMEQVPSLLTILGCMVFAIVRWRRHSKVSLLVLIGLGLLFVHSFVFAVVYTWIPDLFIRSADYLNQTSVIRNVYLVLGLISNSSFGVAFAVLLMAIFIHRPSTSQQ
jgi:hypothetical protein